jgi:hypothetical protein
MTKFWKEKLLVIHSNLQVNVSECILGLLHVVANTKIMKSTLRNALGTKNYKIIRKSINIMEKIPIKLWNLQLVTLALHMILKQSLIVNMRKSIR